MIQLFKDTHIDFIGKKKIFIAVSVALMIAGGISVWLRGFNLGVDFAGGTMAYVRFKQVPPLDQIRKALGEQKDASGKQIIETEKVTIQTISGTGNQLLIRLPQIRGSETQEGGIDAGKRAIIAALTTLNDPSQTGKTDLNSRGVADIRDRLIQLDPLGNRDESLYGRIADRIVDYRDKERSGLIDKVSDVPLDVQGLGDSDRQKLRQALEQNFTAGNFNVGSVEIVGPQVGSELQKRAIYVTLAALVGMLIYIAFRFEWIYGVGAVIAVFHDVMITLGIFSMLQKEISLTVIAALLTLVGYSMNDTIVIFDRIRENLKLRRRDDLIVIVNDSINQTLSRTILTSGLTLLSVISLYLFGGEVLNGFALALLIGIIIGSYSSIGIASPIMIWWKRYQEQQIAAQRAAARASKAKAV